MPAFSYNAYNFGIRKFKLMFKVLLTSIMVSYGSLFFAILFTKLQLAIIKSPSWSQEIRLHCNKVILWKLLYFIYLKYSRDILTIISRFWRFLTVKNIITGADIFQFTHKATTLNSRNFSIQFSRHALSFLYSKISVSQSCAQGHRPGLINNQICRAL